MKILLFLPLVVLLMLPLQNSTSDNPPLTVLTYKWTKTRRTIDKSQSGDVLTPPASAMTPANKNFARNTRVNDPAGVRDPNADTLDTRSSQMEKAVRDSRSGQLTTIDGFAYRTKVQNNGKDAVQILFWEYQFVDPKNTETINRHQFLCGVDIHPGKEKELEGFSVSSPGNVINIESLETQNASPYQEKVVINRVEYANGTIWQRKDWSLKEVKTAYERALRESWVPGMCKAL